MMGISLFLGCLTETYVSRTTLEDWTLSHLPSPEVWGALLSTRDLELITHPILIDRLMAKLHVSWDDPGTIWISDSKEWVAVFPDELKATSIPSFYSRHRIREKRRDRFPKGFSKHLPKEWKRIKGGWLGLEEVYRRLERAKPNKKRLAPQRDPREIRY